CGTSATAICSASATVTGVGDQAFYLTSASPDGTTLTLFVLTGTNVIFVSSQTGLGPLEALMNQIIAQVKAIPVPSPSSPRASPS
ncbi:MAG TPA: hypothetical protein VKY26_11325, partial [Actinomycetota bacterium]|nr:hypothetical protein [Actinomycetota bacterium]